MPADPREVFATLNNDHPALMMSFTFSYTQEGKLVDIYVCTLMYIVLTHAPYAQLNKIIKYLPYYFTVSCMNCQTTSDRAFEELFIQINREVKSVERGYNDWVGPEMINEYQCRGLVIYFHRRLAISLVNEFFVFVSFAKY